MRTRDRERALEIGFRFRRVRLAATSARFRRRCDGPRPRTTFPWLFPPPSSLRRCSAKRHRIGRVPHRLAPNMTSSNGTCTVAPVDRNAVMPEVIVWTASAALPVKATSAALRSIIPNAFQIQGAFFFRQQRQVHRLAPLPPHSFRRGYGSAARGEAQTSTWRLGRSRAHPRARGPCLRARPRDSRASTGPSTDRTRSTPRRPAPKRVASGRCSAGS